MVQTPKGVGCRVVRHPVSYSRLVPTVVPAGGGPGAVRGATPAAAVEPAAPLVGAVVLPVPLDGLPGRVAPDVATGPEGVGGFRFGHGGIDRAGGQVVPLVVDHDREAQAGREAAAHHLVLSGVVLHRLSYSWFANWGHKKTGGP